MDGLLALRGEESTLFLQQAFGFGNEVSLETTRTSFRQRVRRSTNGLLIVPFELTCYLGIETITHSGQDSSTGSPHSPGDRGYV